MPFTGVRAKAVDTPSPSADLNEIQEAIERLSPEQQNALAKWLRWLKRENARKRVAERTAADRRVFYKSPALIWTLASLMAFFLVEGAVFRLGWYNKYLEPNSSAGEVESYLYWLRSTPPSQTPEVVVVGDSRIAEGFSVRAANRATGNRVNFWSLGMGGTSPRIWYYVLRDADPTRRRFRAIVLALDHYADEDSWDVASNRLIDLNFVIGRLRATDCPEFARSMQTREYKDKALAGCLFKGVALRRDFHEFLRDIPDRIKRSEEWRNKGLFYTTNYGGREENLTGLSADFVHRTLTFPPGLDEGRRGSVQAMVMSPPAPQTGELTRYREHWLGKIIDLYRNSPTKIVFLELPRAPVAKPESRVPARFLQWALRRPHVYALPASTFRDLEKPEMFFDGLHLNRTGRELFSQKIADAIPPQIGIF